MGSDNEIPEDEEEILLYVEFEGLVDGNAFNEEQLHLDMIGIDTEHPIMQINGRFYEGTYEDAMGTHMFFARSDHCMADDPVFDTAPSYKYFAKTRKLLKMQRIFIKPRTEVLGDSEHGQCIPNINTLKEAGVPLKYQEEALSFWKQMRDTRINALNSYLEKQRIREEKKSQGIVLDSESDEDNPFAIYKPREEGENIDKSMTVNIGSDKDSKYPSFCDDVDAFENISKETVDEPMVMLEGICPKDFDKLTVETAGSSSKIESDSLQTKSVGVRKSNSATTQKSKARVIHDVRKKSYRKGLTSTKRECIAVDNEGRKQVAGDELLQSDTSNDSDSPISSHVIKIGNDGGNEDETTKGQKFCPESSCEEQADSRIAKQLKREAKMEEMSRRLKVIAEGYLATKAEQ